MSSLQTILAIDDDAGVRSFLDMALSMRYRAFTASNGFEGLQLAEQETVDLILLDLNMPDIDGREVARRLKENPKTRNIPIIMLTGLKDQASKVSGLEAGADEYLTKPISETELLARIRALLRMRDALNEVARLERERHETQLAFASEVQQSLLPQEIPQLPGVDISIRYQPCETIGGDFYDFFTPSEGRFCLILGDAEGHGLSAALLMARAGAYVRASIRSGDFSPARLLTEVNQLVCQDHAASVFWPILCIYLDVDAQILRYANAGHEYPILFQSGQCLPLESTSPMLGVDESEYFEEIKLPLNGGDVLACFTDGLPDAMREEGRSRIQSLLQPHPGKSADDLADRALAAWLDYGGVRAEDDMTLIVTKFG